MAKEKLHIVDAKTEYFISLDEILVCIAAGNYTDIYLVNHTKYPTIRIQVGQLWTKIKELGKMVEHHLERIGRSIISPDGLVIRPRIPASCLIWSLLPRAPESSMA